MRRSKQIFVLHHCLLNQNARAKGLAKRRGVVEEIVEEAIRNGWGIYQIPCPELRFLGMEREPMSKTRYDTEEFRVICKEIAREVAEDLRRFVEVGYEIKGIAGVEGSPSCGVNLTHIGEGGEEKLVEGEGILVEEIKKALAKNGIRINYYGIKLEEGRDC